MHPLIPYFDQPVLHLGPIPLYGFGILVATGFLIGGNVAMRRAKQIGLDPEAINRLIGWLVLGTFVGGHVGYGLMYKFDEYMKDPIQFLYVWDGLSSFGGFVACAPLAVWFFKKEKMPVWPYLDCLAHGFAVGWFLGRMGCFVAHDHPGTPTDFWLGVYGTCPGLGRDVACHDMGLYEALWSLGLFGVFLLLDRRPRVPGFYPILLATLYAPTRFWMDFYRPISTDNRWALGLTPAQYGSILLFGIGVYMLVRRTKSGDAPVWKTSRSEPAQAAS